MVFGMVGPTCWPPGMISWKMSWFFSWFFKKYFRLWWKVCVWRKSVHLHDLYAGYFSWICIASGNQLGTPYIFFLLWSNYLTGHVRALGSSQKLLSLMRLPRILWVTGLGRSWWPAGDSKNIFFWKSLRISWFVEKTQKIKFLDVLGHFIPVPLHRISERLKIEIWFLQQSCLEWWAELRNVSMFGLSPAGGMIWWLQMIFFGKVLESFDSWRIF